MHRTFTRYARHFGRNVESDCFRSSRFPTARSLARYAIPGLLFFASGCSLTGTWRAVSVSPTDSAPIYEEITFDDRQKFSATFESEGDRHTTVGTYQWNGRRLTLSPGNGPRRQFSASRKPGDKLVILNDAVAAATFAKRTEFKRVE